ncbi:oxidoreductase [Scleromatobacter humisilvae]|uniref:Oxidoreductase n=1 Tax=Scleromatobacter humisilvae TaxID=2897159 RepID=A0A9X2C4F3_9BURK|nr:oxidoreductase [Scleromatobacter humisilvae]MCK9689450.1 oxidoreductase [Scleromatobacter humisilvae]
MSSTNHKIFLITGASSGLGRALSVAALADGHTVIGTVRNSGDARRFEELNAGRAHAVMLDVTDFEAIEPAISRMEAAVGPIDVLVNSAGYGHEGILEESPLSALQRQFDVNVFGAVAVMKAVLPSMRERRTGRIINITSMAGLVGLAGVSYYAGSKFALEGISESLHKEVHGFGIRVTAVAPGSFRTDWAARSMVRSERAIADYDAVFNPIRQRRQDYSGRQLGDPDRAAQALLKLVASEAPPQHLLLGNDALALLNMSLADRATERAKWEGTTRSTDHQ